MVGRGGEPKQPCRVLVRSKERTGFLHGTFFASKMTALLQNVLECEGPCFAPGTADGVCPSCSGGTDG